MGCPVNGPGEAKDADIGIAFGPKEAILFEHGEMKSILPLDGVINNFVRIVEDLANVVG